MDIGTHLENVDVHTHDYFELVIILGGNAIHLVDDQEFPIKVGDVFVININSFHGYKDVHQLKLCNIMFDLNKLIDYDIDLKKLSGFQSLFILEPFYRKHHKFESKLELDPMQMIYVEKTLFQLLNEHEQRKDGFKPVIRTYFIFLAAFLSRQFTSGKNTVSDQLFFLAKAIAYIENNYTEQIRIDQVAAMAYMSERHFRRVFQLNYHMTPTDYLIQLRLNLACRLLKEGSFNITEVAAQCGYSDIGFFSKQFKTRLGKSPKEYRKT
ncbi:MAG TPA: AraC family transcriptional regulator [Ruminiclostridium sp.]